MRPEKVLDIELEKLDHIYWDVKDEQTDLKSAYQSTIPDKMADNFYNMDEEDFQHFKKVHMNAKRNLELGLIKENRHKVTVGHIIDLMELKPR